MTDTRIARRYASAAFRLAQKEGGDIPGKRGQVLKDLRDMLDVCPALEAVFKSPIVTVQEKKNILSALLDKVDSDTTTRNFCYLLADKDRLAFFRAIVQAYETRLDEAQGVIRGKLTTAVALGKAKQDAIRADLVAKAGGKEIELSFAVDQAILGGVVLKIGDRVLDASLRAQLEILRETFKRGN